MSACAPTQKQIKIAQDNIVRQRKALEIAEAKFHGGTATKRDVYQAENVLGATEATVPQLTIQLQQSKDALNVLLGMPPGYVDHLLTDTGTSPMHQSAWRSGFPADLLRRRPDIRQAELQAAAQCAQIGYAKADLFPIFSLAGDVGTLGSNVTRGLDERFTGKSLYYSVGPNVQWNILNYGQITNNVRAQDARFQELLTGYQNAVLKAQQEVENGIAAFLYSRDQVVFLQQSVDAAEGALRIAIIQYRQGIADFTTVLTAEQNLYQAQNSLTVAQGNVPLGLIAAYRAMGGGWQLREGNDFIPAQDPPGDGAAHQLGHVVDPRSVAAQGARTPVAQGRRTAGPAAGMVRSGMFCLAANGIETADGFAGLIYADNGSERSCLKPIGTLKPSLIGVRGIHTSFDRMLDIRRLRPIADTGGIRYARLFHQLEGISAIARQDGFERGWLGSC